MLVILNTSVLRLLDFCNLFRSFFLKVKCEVRGDLGPACNSAGMIDRYVLGIDHLYKKPVYRNLKVFLTGI